MKIDKIENLFRRSERYLSPAVFLGGFILDNLTLRRVDLWAENLAIIIYLAVALGSIFGLNAYGAGRPRGRWFDRIARTLPYVLQFVFGGLFSVFVIFYSRSASLFASWPFLFGLAAVFLGNEFFRKRYEKTAFHLAVFFVSLFSYAVFALPVLFRRMGTDIFLLSGFASLTAISLIVFILHKIAPDNLRQSRYRLAAGIGGIFLAFNAMYFLNLIPPIPLSLKESGVYHELRRTPVGYTVGFEPAPWYLFWREDNPVFHWRPGQPVYVYNAVFAPTEITTEIFHRWSYYDENKDEWIADDTLGFSIRGGRDSGYRGYSVKYGVRPGRWRIDIITEHGQVLGRLFFVIVEAEETPALRTREK